MVFVCKLDFFFQMWEALEETKWEKSNRERNSAWTERNKLEQDKVCHKTWGCNWSFGIDTYVHTMYILKWWNLNRKTYPNKMLKGENMTKNYNKAEKKKKENFQYLSIKFQALLLSTNHLVCVHVHLYVYLFSGSNSQCMVSTKLMYATWIICIHALSQ